MHDVAKVTLVGLGLDRRVVSRDHKRDWYGLRRRGGCSATTLAQVLSSAKGFLQVEIVAVTGHKNILRLDSVLELVIGTLPTLTTMVPVCGLGLVVLLR